ncbi:hypothetical protein BRX37_20135 [Sphingomonas sp. S-NIH.Pt3_0716]|nr:hypothetical protein BRX37_20135 [Sphingomonas sp. S-NIH.Pt3_0716]
MGWLTMPFRSMGGHTSAKAYLDDQFTYSRSVDGGTAGLRVLASSCPKNRTYYAAVQVMTNGIGGDVFAVVCLLAWNHRSTTGEQFGYKDMTESMGPNAAECPKHILDLLTPTDKEFALDWRRRCSENLARRSRKVADGDRVRFAEPLSFTDGHTGQEFIVERRGRRLSFRDPDGHGRYRIRNFMQSRWDIVPVTKVHKTIFA